VKTLFDKAYEALGLRGQWEQKQRLYYQMRHDGLRRRNKPWPSAADLHFPLVDMNIRKAKPFWESQATSAERLASFVSLQDQLAADTTAAADFFDFELRQNTNFLPELNRSIDTMCLRGRGVIKCVTDPFDDHRILCEGIDPLFIIMADGADDFEDADWFVHVIQLSVARYRRQRIYEQDQRVIDQIKGSKDADVSSGLDQDKEQREGVSYSRNPNQIILWEHYERTMGGWTRNTYSPMKPDLRLRQPSGVPYKIGGKVSLPFFSFKMEIKDKGWYSPRGLAELNATFEAYASKLWNEKTDAMTFGNRPVFTSETQIPNTASIRWNPGEFIPGNIKAVAMPAPAFSFDQEIAFARSISEQLSMLPDFGISQPGTQQDSGKPRTATENNRIATLQTVGTESQGRIFRMDLAKVYRHLWGLLLQFKRKKLSYYVAGELKTLPEQALHDAYLITPDGAPDQWNKQQRVQRAMARLQTFGNSPNVDQDVLVRDALAADDPKLALEAFIPSGLKAASESEDEAEEIQILKDGFPAAVRPNEDHAARIHVLMGWLQKQAQSGAQLDPVAVQRIHEHLALHWQFLKKMDPKAAHQLQQQIMQMEAQPGPGGPAGPAGPGPGPGPAQPGQPPQPPI
jgi:hypothetical protein